MRVLFSVHPEFADKMISGEKRYEFRKRLPIRSCVDGFAIYATLPVGKVVAQGRIGKMLALPPDEMWDKTGAYSGLRRDDFDRYFSKSRNAYAIELLDIIAIEPPIPLLKYAPQLTRPPQSYAYID